MSNDGYRIIIDRNGGKFYWSYTLSGEQYEGNRAEPTVLHAADLHRR
jgi:hypothetical protein